jgi:hypothetical protein
LSNTDQGFDGQTPKGAEHGFIVKIDFQGTNICTKVLGSQGVDEINTTA